MGDSYIEGGYADARSHLGSSISIAKALKNRVRMNTNMRTEKITGGYTFTETRGGIRLYSNENQVHLRTNANDVAGGRADGKQFDRTGIPVALSTVEANANKVWVDAGAGTFTDKSAADFSTIEVNNVQEAKAQANANELTVRGGTFHEDTATGSSFAKTTSTSNGSVNAEADNNKLWAYDGTFQKELYGGSAEAATSAPGGLAEADASRNMLYLAGGTYEGDIYGGRARGASAAANTFLTADENTINICGGTYHGDIYAGDGTADSGAHYADTYAHIHDNKIEIFGAYDLSRASLYGYRANTHSIDVSGNALVIRNTKSITVTRAANFQKIAFWVPKGITENDTMLTVTDTANTDLSGVALTAHLRGDETINRIRLLHTKNAEITTNAATTMNVYHGISGHTPALMHVTTDNKELIVKVDGSATDAGGSVPTPPSPSPSTTPPPSPPPIVPTPPSTSDLPPETPWTPHGGFILSEDHAKSLAETMAGSVAFIGSGMNLFTGLGMSSASIEAAAAEGFAPFAAMSGSSMRIATGSHVDLKGMSLAVGFSREVLRGDERILFGPIVEYGRGTYDSYVNDAHGDGSVRYVGAGAFVRQEQKDGTFYEGSLRFGRSSMDYATSLTSYDTDANYIGAHLGFGQRVTEQSGSERELYVRYFYTRQNGTDTKLSTGERYDFDAVQSQRLRTGARWTIPQKGGSLIVGASMQYEFGGDANATVHVGGLSYTTPSPSLKGFSGSLELGWKAPIGKNATADLSVEGWAGKQRGITFNAGFDWKF